MGERKIEREIEKKQRLTGKSKKRVLRKIYIDYTIAIIIVIYLTYITLASIFLERTMFELISNIGTFIILALSLISFEVSFRKYGKLEEAQKDALADPAERFICDKTSSGTMAIRGLELLILSIFSLFIPHIFLELRSDISTYIVAGAGFTVAYYYLIKSIFVYKYQEKRYRKFACDITEIIKKEPKRKKRTI